MMRATILTIHKDCRMDGKKLSYTTEAELYLDSGMERTIKKVSLWKCGRSKTCRLEEQLLDRETGGYWPVCKRKELPYKEGEKLIAAWKQLPVEEARKAQAGTTQSETRYLK